MQGTDYATTAADIISGFTFEWHVSFAVMALAAYGFTGESLACGRNRCLYLLVHREGLSRPHWAFRRHACLV